MFLFFSTIVGSLSPLAFGRVYKSLNLEPHVNPKGLGDYLSLFTLIPCAISIPLFYIAGLKYKKIKCEQLETERLDKET